MDSLLRRVKTKLTIHAHRKVRGLIEGEYRSVFHGRSMDFDDLRPYVPGDEFKDIDWKATARHGSPLTKRYIASRKHTLVLVVDTGRDMAALAESGESKRDLAILAAGTAGYIAIRHGDMVALVTGTSEATHYMPPEVTESHLERVLQRIHSSTTLAGEPSNLSRHLDYVARNFRRRMIVMVIADDRPLAADEQRLVRRLTVQHEVLWLTIGDADLMREEWTGSEMYDVADSARVPEFLRHDTALRAEFSASIADAAMRSEELFESLTVSSRRITSAAGVVPGLFRLLEAHKHARR
ncbi:DUF58 domain-containing protein [Salinibacterium sp. G-O1]|uniref:DUF58 domain-containing protein n=1 Tax=Salinibacterium sp. G-O1 TaxID=3046208 RepID=UPI0024BA9263|nr:DUF58 domain-containing protein [Salinibacterium sp. G-O1]MDJ0334723.1 DUF58 domain-containing protein [Salinibacterium sp. G-O1]